MKMKPKPQAGDASAEKPAGEASPQESGGTNPPPPADPASPPPPETGPGGGPGSGGGMFASRVLSEEQRMEAIVSLYGDGKPYPEPYLAGE